MDLRLKVADLSDALKPSDHDLERAEGEDVGLLCQVLERLLLDEIDGAMALMVTKIDPEAPGQ